MQKLLLTGSLRVFGHWWVLGQSDRVLAGELTYEPASGVRLEVVGRFVDLPSAVAVGDEAAQHNLVLGRTKDQDITLYDCRQVNMTINIPGDGSTMYQPAFALFGAHDDGTEPFTTHEVSARIPVLDAWLPLTGIASEVDFDTCGRRLSEYRIRYRSPEPQDAELPWGRIKVAPGADFGGQLSLANRNASVREWIDLTFVLNNATPVVQVLNDRVGPLVDMSTLLTSYPARLTYFALRDSSAERDGGQSGAARTFDVLFHNARAAEPAPKIDDRKYLLPPNHPAAPPFADLVSRWYSSRSRYGRAMDMLFGMERRPSGTYTEVRFITLCHAAEALHRDMALPQERYSRADYKRLQNEALAAMSDEAAKDFLREQFRYANQITLRERLIALRDLAFGSRVDLISDNIVGRITKARNNLTHSSTKDLARLDDITDLYYLTEYVNWLLRGCFLIQVGIDQEQTAQLLDDSDRFSWLRRSFPGE